MAASLWEVATANAFSTSLNGSITAADESLTLTTSSGLVAPGVLVIDRQDSSGTNTPSLREYITYTGVNSETHALTGVTRGVAGSNAQAHGSGATVEEVMSITHWGDLVDYLQVGHDSAGNHTITGTASIAQVYIGTYINASGASVVGFSTSSGSASFWTAITGTYASGTTFTVATDITTYMLKGVLVKWLSSADALKVGMVVSSSYGAPNTTITIVGSVVEAGDKSFNYCIHPAKEEVFIIPGNQAIGTNVSKTWKPAMGVYPISVDANVSTAGTTNATTYDVNDDGTTIITTKPSIASEATADLNNVVDAPTTAIAAASAVTVDIDAASTTQAIDGYISLFYLPVDWVSRS